MSYPRTIRTTPTQLDLALRECGVDPAQTLEVTELTEGTFNTAYRIVAADGTRWVLKIAPRPDAPAMTYERTLMRTEAMFYRTAAGRLPVPRIRYTSTTPTALGSDFLLMTECPGASWHSQREGLTAHAPRLRTDLGAMVANLHQITGAGFGYPQLGLAMDWPTAFLGMADSVVADAERFGVTLPLSPGELRELFHAGRDLFTAVRTPSLVHFDLWDGNILIDVSGQAPRIGGVIDGERAFWGDPVAELVSLALFGRIDDDVDFLAGYRGVTPLVLDAPALRRLAYYRAYLYLIMTVEAVPRGQDGPERRPFARFLDSHLRLALTELASGRLQTIPRT